MKWTFLCSGFCVAAISFAAVAADLDTDHKKVTFISTRTTADGKSRIARELVEECIVSLPSATELEADVTTESRYLKKISGDENENRWTKVYTATVTINYLLRQSELIIITTNSVEAQEPVIKEVKKTIRQSHTVTSDPNDGDLWAGPNHDHYYTTLQKAKANAEQRALVWIKQQKNTVCP